MKKEETIGRYGEAAYEKQLEQGRQWNEANPDRVEENQHNQTRKGGSGYEKKLEYHRIGVSGDKSRIRCRHAKEYKQFKDIIAPDSQLHHQWRPGTSKYDGVALVETNQHMRGFIDVIQILEGEITLLTEKEIRNAG